ncbi:glycosyl-4,4'-diaponeurosporenoate acyltransferase [Bhargavaea cecembensis]|uniref:Glycosyl-4,4'-diaponeurosporenoate acyltransferase n=1 Tax=Bhargavaea cecembensis TaxID=394098 RepID=A0A161RCL9_9BACL|nr:hypothetical protein [Bhargavaea cecembensis]KZE37292.1 glycosyl-4,4'-diaponeurosporenoate acyltransferase [Bhargavaea cecembensis]
MQVIELPMIWTIVADIAVWALFHLAISYALYRLPLRLFEKETALTRIRSLEQNGRIWQRLSRVRQWKDRLPDGDSVIGRGFPKKRLGNGSKDYLRQFAAESRRAEWTHWLLIPPAFLFFLWNPPWAGWVMVAYALAANLPFILIQRFNRPRLLRLSDRMAIHKEEAP